MITGKRMTWAPGTRIGAYVIDAALGAGAMGEVYRATDTRLGRRVAIKVLPRHLAEQSTRRARFVREAHAASRLAHRHVCAVYDVGDHDGLPFIVMEYIDGETLARRLERGALPLFEAVTIAAEIADALEYAHREGVVHRDLKPANVLLTAAGTKLLDFGLATLESRPIDVPLAVEAAAPSTETLTADGVILGTVQYASPEQLEGCATDGRSDIFALGAILYEMVCGRPVFAGPSKASIIAAVLERTPPPIAGIGDTHSAAALPLLNDIVSRCLTKRPDERWQTASSLKDALLLLQRGASAPHLTHAREPRFGRQRWIAAGLLMVLALVANVVLWRSRPASSAHISFEVHAPEDVTFNPAAAFMALSPDGRHLAFVGSSRSGGRALWLRSLDSVVARQLPGTDNAAQPFWSADSRFIGFTGEGRLRTIDVVTHVVQTLTDAGITAGTWNHRGEILFTPSPTERRLPQGIVHVISAGGGNPQPLSRVGAPNDLADGWPVFLPDGRQFLVVAQPDDPRDPAVLTVRSLDSDQRVTLFPVESHAAYAAGHLLFVQGGRLVAQPFDWRTLTTTSEPIVIAENVELNDLSRRGSFTVSNAGVLAYRIAGEKRLAWFDRQGRLQQVLGEPARYGNPALSPDGQRIAVERADSKNGQWDIWIVDVRDGGTLRFTHTGAEKPLWTTQSDRIVFRARQTHGGFMSRALQGHSADEMLLDRASPFDGPMSVLPADEGIIYSRFDATTRSADLWMLALAGDRTPVRLTSTPFAVIDGRVSPDGRWLAYVSNETGTYDVYVRPFPSGAGKWRISSGGGSEPLWRADGRELFYLAADRSLMSVTVTTDGVFHSKTPVRMFKTQLSTAVNTAYTRNQYAVSADGERVLICEPTGMPPPITVIVNWTARLRTR